MATQESTSKQISDLRAQLAKLEEQGRRELQERRAALLLELAGIDQELADMDGAAAPKRTAIPATPGKKRGPKPKAAKKAKGSHKDFPDLAALKTLLSKAPDKRLNRKGFNDAGFTLKSAIVIAKENSTTFGHKQNKAQGEVWLK